MEQLCAYAARRAGAQRTAVRFVNVLASAGAVSEIFLQQSRAGVPLTVTDTGMLRYWITMGARGDAGRARRAAGRRGSAAGHRADPVVLTVGELAKRIWTLAGNEGEPDMDVIGIRPGETTSEVLIGPGEELGDERHQGIARDRRRDPDRGARPGCSSDSLRAAAARRRARSGSRRCAGRAHRAARADARIRRWLDDAPLGR